MMQSKIRKLPGWIKLGLIVAVVVILSMKFFSSCKKVNGDLQVARTAKVERGNLSVVVEATGTVKPYNRVEIKAPIAGRIDEVLVREGDEVKQGQVLARMSSTERAVLLDAARPKGEEVVKRWEEAYQPAPLLAPLDGTIIVRSVEPGQTVTTADPVVVLSDRLIVEALVDETDLAFIRLGQPVEITLDAYRDQEVPGSVHHIAFESMLENNVNVYAIDVVPTEMLASFRSGMSANLTFIMKDLQDVLLVPSEAVVAWPKTFPKPQGAEFAVYEKRFSGKLVPLAVRIGESDGRMTEITEGLKEGAQVVIVRKKEKPKSANPFSPGSAPKKSNTQGQGGK